MKGRKITEEMRAILKVANLLELYEFFEKKERRQLHKKKMTHILKR